MSKAPSLHSHPDMDVAKAPSLRPSDASRWTICTAAPSYVESIRDQLPVESKDYTNEGSVAHELVAMMLKDGGADIAKAESKVGYALNASQRKEMLKHAQGYVDHIAKLRTPDADIYIEEPVKRYYQDDQNDVFIDCALVEPKRVFIIDLKYGQGVSVEAKGNKQLAIYARSFMDANAPVYGFTQDTLVVMQIYQPRMSGEQAVRLWTVSYGELVDWCLDEIDAHVHDIAEGRVKFSPSEDACRFCQAKAVCPARLESINADMVIADLDMHDINVEEEFPLSKPTELSIDVIAKVLTYRKAITKWFEEVEDYARDCMEQGVLTVPGFKLVESRTNRKWVDEGEALEFLKRYFKKDEYVVEKVVSPSQAEKLMSEKEFKRNADKIRSTFDSLITKPSGKPTLAPDSDKRPAIEPVIAANEFPTEEALVDDLL